MATKLISIKDKGVGLSINDDSNKKTFESLKVDTIIPNKEIMKKLLFERLEKYGIIPEDFSKILKENGAVLTGSFPLQCVLEETWNNSDIDIFIKQTPDFSKLDNVLAYMQKCFSPIEKVDEEKPYNRYEFNKDDFNNIYDFMATDLLGENKIKVQLVSIAPSLSIDSVPKTDFTKDLTKNLSIIDYINNNFDFSFCKIIYDGDDFICPNWNDIYYKSGTFEIHNFVSDCKFLLMYLERTDKYEKRGFKIKFTVDFIKKINNIIEAIYKKLSYINEKNYSSKTTDIICNIALKRFNSTKFLLENIIDSQSGNRQIFACFYSGQKYCYITTQRFEYNDTIELMIKEINDKLYSYALSYTDIHNIEKVIELCITNDETKKIKEFFSKKTE